jgi:hypothetical protein
MSLFLFLLPLSVFLFQGMSLLACDKQRRERLFHPLAHLIALEWYWKKGVISLVEERERRSGGESRLSTRYIKSTSIMTYLGSVRVCAEKSPVDIGSVSNIGVVTTLCRKGENLLDEVLR